jgi:hypothetical protein
VTLKGENEEENLDKLNNFKNQHTRSEILHMNYCYREKCEFITFSDRESAEAAVKFFGSETCKYADKKQNSDCALFISFDTRNINYSNNGKDDINDVDNIFNDNNYLYEELHWIFSYGEKVTCKVELSRKEDGEYDGKAIIEYSPDENGERVCFNFIYDY